MTTEMKMDGRTYKVYSHVYKVKKRYIEKINIYFVDLLKLKNTKENNNMLKYWHLAIK